MGVFLRCGWGEALWGTEYVFCLLGSVNLPLLHGYENERKEGGGEA